LETVRERPVGYFPFSLFGLGTLLNRILQALPIVRWLALVDVIVLRPVVPSSRRPSLSIVIPARNEKGNITSALSRLPDLRVPTEVIFVEGHSSDGTWEEIQRRMHEYRGPCQIRAIQQRGKGKSDAVRLGFSVATNELLTILDADLTMPPEQLGRFYDAYVAGFGDFINGNRLVYPMEGEAMRFLNHLGNIFFAKLLSFVLETDLGDSLCGTKLMSKRDYERFVAWRKDFGEFDPFGDFEIIFPACIMGLGVMEVPIHYRARMYGATNINRFRHGIVLLKMSLIGLVRVRLGR
jgi:glycosyltransferase involved in cell wall biosynthesis